MTDVGRHRDLGGDFPVNMSGGVLSSNPIGASGMIRFLEAANQVRGTAGDYQVDGRDASALGHAYGGAAQYFAMWIVGDRPSTRSRRRRLRDDHRSEPSRRRRFSPKRAAFRGEVREWFEANATSARRRRRRPSSSAA